MDRSIFGFVVGQRLGGRPRPSPHRPRPPPGSPVVFSQVGVSTCFGQGSLQLVAEVPRRVLRVWGYILMGHCPWTSCLAMQKTSSPPPRCG